MPDTAQAESNNAIMVLWGKAQEMKEEIGKSYTRRTGVQRGYLGEALKHIDRCLDEITQAQPGYISRAMDSFTRAACLAGHAGRML